MVIDFSGVSDYIEIEDHEAFLFDGLEAFTISLTVGPDDDIGEAIRLIFGTDND